MEDRLYLAKLLTIVDALNKIEPIHVVGNIQIGQVAHLASVGKVIYHQDVGLSALVESLDNITADKSGTTGYDNHAVPLIFSTMDVVECPSTNCKISTVPPFSITQRPPATSSGW